jgi:BirA family biotin operon repressor/biotin-[acetyl-CoA-carboxylase] ligase
MSGLKRMPSMSASRSSLVDPLRVRAFLEAAGRVDIIAVAECASTNTVLLQRAKEGAPSGTVLVADRQTAGRGSRGRVWLASPEASLTFSILWKFPGVMARLSGLSLAAGVAVVRALAHCGVQGVLLKWPNDILYGGGKLGGILVELAAVRAAVHAVVGIGLNLRLPENVGQAGGAALPPTALERIVAVLPERNFLLAALLDWLVRVFDRFDAQGFAGWQETWQACNAWRGKPVRVSRDGHAGKEGICIGADADGALLLRTADGLERCLSGDVSLRLR